MISFKCKTCGGEMSVDSSGALVCEYCGGNAYFDDRQLAGYKEFRQQMLNYLKGVHESDDGRDEDRLWSNAEEKQLRTSDGESVTIRYLYSYEDDAGSIYLTRKNAIFIYGSENKSKADKTLWSIKALSFPPADVKGLADCFPKLSGRYDLEDGGVMLTFERTDNLFPLSLFGSLDPKHVAWIISRLENICCVLNYSELVHGGISADSVWINPFIHHAVLMGHWQSAMRTGISGMKDQELSDLKDLRKTAERILGNRKEEAPAALMDFLHGQPSEDAFSDFEKWDNVIEKGFGGRHFAGGLSINDLDV
ncbi:MAG: hypothetical protein K5871_07880 [Lachnospiraceae bacterium]|nr:hypothetical protein [Lachnospiraceae bacterium]